MPRIVRIQGTAGYCRVHFIYSDSDTRNFAQIYQWEGVGEVLNKVCQLGSWYVLKFFKKLDDIYTSGKTGY